MFCGPGSRCKFCDALDGCVSESGQNVGEVIANGDFESAAAFDHGEDSGYARSGLFAPDMDPVISANCDGPHRVLRKVVAELEFGIIEEADQLIPKSKRVSAGLAGSALGQRRLVHLQ